MPKYAFKGPNPSKDINPQNKDAYAPYELANFEYTPNTIKDIAPEK